jgi:putative acetyltransferase
MGRVVAWRDEEQRRPWLLSRATPGLGLVGSARAATVGCVAVQVREEQSDDAEAVAEVHRAAFGCDGAVVAALVDDLRAVVRSGDGLSLVADRDGVVVGHVMFSRGLLDAPARLVAVQILSPVGVRPAMQGQGIAAALIARGVEILSARRVPAVFLEGDPGYYSRLGFVPAKSLGFRKPSLRIPDGAFQVMTLAAHEPWMTGTVVYHDAFWRHDAVGLRDRRTADEVPPIYQDGSKARPPELP